MKIKITQKQRVVKRLREYGQITRNECLRCYISRLSAIIQTLEEEGWVFVTENVNGDFIYKVTGSPYKKVAYTLSNGEQIVVSEKV